MFGTTRIYAGMSNVIYELNKTRIYVWMKYRSVEHRTYKKKYCWKKYSIKTDTSSTSSFYRYYDTISMNDIATMRYGTGYTINTNQYTLNVVITIGLHQQLDFHM